jgi:hypothetical protein
MLGLTGIILPKVGIKSVGFLKAYGWKIGSYLYPQDYAFIILLVGAFYFIHKVKNSGELEKTFQGTSKVALACSIGFALCLFGMNKITEFIYFQF